MTMHHLMYELPSVQGHALLAGAVLTDPMCDDEPNRAYIHQEIEKRRHA
jgi:hypothetical protein